MQEKCRKYGIITAISMIVGSVIGSGVFFKAEIINRITGGNIFYGAIAWCIGGAVMMVCLLNFSAICSQCNRQDGLFGYAAATVGERYAYYLGWFMMSIYYPSMTSVLAWLSSVYTLTVFGIEDFAGGMCMLLACMYLTASFVLNSFSAYLSGKFQVMTTFIKLVPLVTMIVFGITQRISENLSETAFEVYNAEKMPLFSAIVSTAFAYEGWITATNVGNNLRNSGKNLPKALVLGGMIVATVYILYYIGISNAVDTARLADPSSGGVRMAYNSLFGNSAGKILILFVAISCIGALNGLMYGCIRGMYVISLSENGPVPELFSSTEPITQIPISSSIVGFVVSMCWLFFYFGAKISSAPLFGRISFDSSELPIITIYAMYIPIFVAFAKKYGKENFLKNILLPFAGAAACVFMVLSAIFAHKTDVINYLFAFATIMLIGAVFEKRK